MTETYRLGTIQDAIGVGTTLSKSWFRGHSRVIDGLVPRMFRAEFWDEPRLVLRPALELEIIETFRRHALLLSREALPSPDDHLGWLCLMQHYGTPTRLLDWTENVLTALCFAVASDQDEDAELWAMRPWALYRVANGRWGVPIPDRDARIQLLVRQSRWAGKSEELAMEVGLDEPVTCPIPLDPSRSSSRMAAQSSAFTIHPSPHESTLSIENALDNQKHLVRYIIPAGAKQKLRDQLHALGVHDMALFPDLEGLSHYVVHESRIMAYGPPDPPHCGGAVEWNCSDRMIGTDSSPKRCGS